MYGLMSYFILSGRGIKSEYWWFILIGISIGFVREIVDVIIFSSSGGEILGFLSIIYYLAVFIPGLAVLFRRLQYTDRSCWWWLICFIPLSGAIVLVVCACLDSTPDNKYGKNPKGSSGESCSKESLSRLEKLHELKEKGAITQEEFEAKKQELLD